jgi:foldase protein PrsA
LRQYGSDVIEALIEGVLLEQEADRRGLETSREQAREQLTKIYQADKLAILDAAFTSDALNRAVERELASLQVMGTKIQEIVEEQNIEISDDEILQYYLDNLPRWTRPEMVRFSIIVVSTQDAAAAARARILSGEDFGAVCREVSEHTQTRAYDGDIGDYIPRNSSNQQNKIIEDTAFSLPVGGVSEPFQVGANWFILKVTDKRDAYEPTLGEKREEIIARLLQDRVAPFVFGWRRNLWAAADITVVYPIYADNPSPDFSGDELMPLG